MTTRKPYLQHLKSSADLVTTYEATRAGFVALALEKNRRATPFIAQARALKTAASRFRSPEELLALHDIQPALLAAAALSDKSLVHLQPEDKAKAIQELIQNFLVPAGKDWIEELVYRFLLTRGDSLGGSMRNVGGALAQRKLTRAIISALSITGRKYEWLSSKSNSWIPMTDDDSDIELHLRGLSWRVGKHPRTLIYNLTVPMVKSNVDLCLFHCGPYELTGKDASKTVFNSPNRYLALGELKGGIDPAGADEHWKTARTALIRIQQAFNKFERNMHTFFIGAAIEKRMANEIWQQLRDGIIENAANLTDDNQVASISRWLCRICAPEKRSENMNMKAMARLMLAALVLTLGQRAIAQDQPYVVEYYYKTKWGFTDEFLQLFKKNHLPVLKKQMESGRILNVKIEKPRLHGTEDGRWDFRVTIAFKSAAAFHAPSGEEAIVKSLYPDQAAFKREEQRRFEILIAHWDVPIVGVE